MAKKKEKVNLQEYWDANPMVRDILKEISLKYINDIQKFMEENTDAHAIVKISFEISK